MATLRKENLMELKRTTLNTRLQEVSRRLVDSGKYGADWSEVADATVVIEAITRISALEAALNGVIAHCEWVAMKTGDLVLIERIAREALGSELETSEDAAAMASYRKTRDCEHEWIEATDTPGWQRCPKCRAGRTVETASEWHASHSMRPSREGKTFSAVCDRCGWTDFDDYSKSYLLSECTVAKTAVEPEMEIHLPEWDGVKGTEP